MIGSVFAITYMPVVTALGRDNPLKVYIFLLMSRRRPVLTRFGIVRIVDFLGGERWKFDTDGSVHSGIVSCDHLALYEDKSRFPLFRYIFPSFLRNLVSRFIGIERNSDSNNKNNKQEAQGVDQATVVRLRGFQELNVSLLVAP